MDSNDPEPGELPICQSSLLPTKDGEGICAIGNFLCTFSPDVFARRECCLSKLICSSPNYRVRRFLFALLERLSF